MSLLPATSAFSRSARCLHVPRSCLHSLESTFSHSPRRCTACCCCCRHCLQVLSKPEFTKSMLEKLVWICAFMLVGARHGGCTVGEVEGQVRLGVGWGA